MGPGARIDPARDHALLAAVANDPRSGLAPADATASADRAMDALRRAVADGFRNADEIDTDFDILRQRADFPPLLLDLAMPADPFAR